MNELRDFPFYEPNKPPQYYKYHSKISYLDELERIWGKRWGAQGIGKLREVTVAKPTEKELDPLFDRDPAYFMYDGTKPNLELAREQHDNMVSAYKREGIKVHYIEFPEGARGAYGALRGGIWAATCFVINGGAIIERQGPPFWRGIAQYTTKFLAGLGCPILYTIHGKGVCTVGAFTRMTDDFIVGMLSTDCNEEAIEQVRPILERSGYKEILIARSPGPLNYFYDEALHWMHPDMWIAPVDVRLALIYPPACDYQTIRRLMELGYKLIEVPREEQLKYFTCNSITLEPRRMLMAEGSKKTVAALKSEGVEVIEIPYNEMMKFTGGLRCTTGHLIRAPGPKLFE